MAASEKQESRDFSRGSFKPSFMECGKVTRLPACMGSGARRRLRGGFRRLRREDRFRDRFSRLADRGKKTIVPWSGAIRPLSWV